MDPKWVALAFVLWGIAAFLSGYSFGTWHERRYDQDLAMSTFRASTAELRKRLEDTAAELHALRERVARNERSEARLADSDD